MLQHQYSFFPEESNCYAVEEDRDKISGEDGGEKSAVQVSLVGDERLPHWTALVATPGKHNNDYALRGEKIYLPVGKEKGEGSKGEGDEEVLDEDPASEGCDGGVHLDEHGSDQLSNQLDTFWTAWLRSYF